jgi:uncharacterized damage-inducible protein DinB
LEAAAQLSGEELARDFGTADGSVLGTLVHLFAADRVWLARVRGLPNPVFATDGDRSLAALQDGWPQILQGWKDWAANLTDERAREQLAYSTLNGSPLQQPVWEVVLHVVNHGTHHRGQVSGFLRALGRKPPTTDLIYFYRQFYRQREVRTS